jgi:hypothetical protein
MPYLTKISHLQGLVSNLQRRVINNEIEIACHNLFEDTVVLCEETEENNDPQKYSLSLV